MDREELFKKADEMRASPPSYFKFDNLHDLDDNADGYGLDKGRYILCGQSSGGNLALVTSMRLKDTPYKPLGQVLCYSVLDQKTDPDDKPDHCDDERKDLYRFYFQCYIGDAAPGTPEISPLFFEADDFKGLPETIMIEGGLNELKSENISLFKKLCDSGVKVQMAFYPDSPHGFLVNQKAEWKEAQEHIFNEAKRIFTL